MKYVLVLISLIASSHVFAAGGGAPQQKKCPMSSDLLSSFFGGVANWTEVIPGTNKKNPKNTFKAKLNFSNPTGSTIYWGSKEVPLTSVEFSGSSCNSLKIFGSIGSASLQKPNNGILKVFGYPLKPSNQVQATLPGNQQLQATESTVTAS